MGFSMKYQLSTSLILLSLCAGMANSSPKRPNILWISCEDLSPHLGCYGDHTVPTPNIDALAKEGVRYTHAFATTGVCAPSRHALITGMYPTSTYAFHMRNIARTGALKEIKDPATLHFARTRPLYEAVPPAAVRCFTEYLRLAGYYCSNHVKEDYQFHPPVTAWDDSSKQAHWRNRQPGQPFFAVFNLGVTHESGVFGKGRSPSVVDPNNVPVPPYYPDNPIIRRDLAKHYDNIIVLDKQVGALIDQLREDGLLDKTIVFFFSDHGDGLPRCKRWVYDSGTRVPLIIRFPDGRRAGTTSDRLVSFVDFGPTVLSLVGIPVPGQVQGKAFLGKQETEQRSFVYLHRDRNGENRETVRAIRDQRYRYVRNYRPQEPYIKSLSYRDRQAIMQELNRLIAQDALGPQQWQFSAQAKPLEEFYDTVTDPHEINNLAADPQHFVRMARMRAALDKWISGNDDPLDMPEHELVRTRVYPPEGKKPTTAAPVVRLKRRGSHGAEMTVTCETEGASIGYRRFKETDTKSKGAPWTIYQEPVELMGPGQYEVKAHRLGFKPSRNVIIDLP